MGLAEAPKKRHHPDGHLSSPLSKRLFTLCQASSMNADDSSVACSDTFVTLRDQLSSREDAMDSHFGIAHYGNRACSKLSSTLPEVTIVGFCVDRAPTENTKFFHDKRMCKGSWLNNIDPARSHAEVDMSDVIQNCENSVNCSLCCDQALSGESGSSKLSYRWNRNWEHWKKQLRPEDEPGRTLRGGKNRHLFSSRQTKTCSMPWIARYCKLSTWSCLADKTGSTYEDLFEDTEVASASLISAILTEFQSAGISRVITKFMDQTKRGMAISNGPSQKEMEIKSGDNIRVEVLKGLGGNGGLRETKEVGQKCNRVADSDAIFSPVTIILDKIDDATDSSYILPSSLLAVADDAGLDSRALTIDHAFEDYFSELLHM